MTQSVDEHGVVAPHLPCRGKPGQVGRRASALVEIREHAGDQRGQRGEITPGHGQCVDVAGRENTAQCRFCWFNSGDARTTDGNSLAHRRDAQRCVNVEPLADAQRDGRTNQRRKTSPFQAQFVTARNHAHDSKPAGLVRCGAPHRPRVQTRESDRRLWHHGAVLIEHHAVQRRRCRLRSSGSDAQ